MITIGSVVKSQAGHDQDRFYVVLALDYARAYLADGKRRKLAKPKAKNRKHLSETTMVLDVRLLTNDCQVRKALRELNDSREQECPKGGNDHGKR